MKTPPAGTALFLDSQTAMREALVRLARQAQLGPAAKVLSFYVGPDACGGREMPLYCAVGIVLGPYALWAKSHYRDLRKVVAPIAPDAPKHVRLWQALMNFHDNAWEPDDARAPEVQLKDWARTRHSLFEPNARRLVEFLEL